MVDQDRLLDVRLELNTKIHTDRKGVRNYQMIFAQAHGVRGLAMGSQAVETHCGGVAVRQSWMGRLDFGWDGPERKQLNADLAKGKSVFFDDIYVLPVV